MKSNTSKSSITLPPNELKLVENLVKQLGASSKVEVIRRSLTLLKNQTDREALRLSYKEASRKARKINLTEMEELDDLTYEGLS